jgi:hypothetical protein
LDNQQNLHKLELKSKKKQNLFATAISQYENVSVVNSLILVSFNCDTSSSRYGEILWKQSKPSNNVVTRDVLDGGNLPLLCFNTRKFESRFEVYINTKLPQINLAELSLNILKLFIPLGWFFCSIQ